MTARLQQARLNARRDLHREAAVPALYIYGSEEPLPVTVRVHERTALIGDIPGLAVTHSHDTSTHLRFWRDEIVLPKRGAKVSVTDGEAYILGEAFDPHGETIDINATRLTAAEAAGLPLPDAA